MSLITNGITSDVIREIMPPYQLSPDLLEATFAALPRPPDASPAWRQARVARLMQEFATLMPANAAQARMVSQVLIMWELADAIAIRALAPELTGLPMCRVGRASAELVRTAMGLVGALERAQQKPVPFFGTVLADGIDLGALDAVWGTGVLGSVAGGSLTARGRSRRQRCGKGITPFTPRNCLARRSVPPAAGQPERVVHPRRRRHRRCPVSSSPRPAIPAPVMPATGGKSGGDLIVTTNPKQLSATFERVAGREPAGAGGPDGETAPEATHSLPPGSSPGPCATPATGGKSGGEVIATINPKQLSRAACCQ